MHSPCKVYLFPIDSAHKANLFFVDRHQFSFSFATSNILQEWCKIILSSSLQFSEQPVLVPLCIFIFWKPAIAISQQCRRMKVIDASSRFSLSMQIFSHVNCSLSVSDH